MFDRTISALTVLREVRIFQQPAGPTSAFSAVQVTTGGNLPGIKEHALAPLPGGGALLFGGAAPFGPFALTYELQGTSWNKQLSTVNPLTRSGHAIVLDEARGENVLFGGADPLGGVRNDTWTYQAGQWSYLTPASSPPPRTKHAMAYDPSTNTSLLFGGEDSGGSSMGDMWQWNGVTWQQLSPSSLPPARYGHGMAWDGYRGRLVLFGGSDGAARLDDIWEWDGANWTQVAPAQPAG